VRRWLVRFIREARPTVEQVKKAADALDNLRTFVYRMKLAGRCYD
jgi:hypothetical protein